MIDGLGSLPAFKPHSDPEKVGQLWTKWKRSLDLCFRSKGLPDDDHRKQALLLHMTGPEVQEIYYSQTADVDNSYQESMTLLDSYFFAQNQCCI